jgi:hypothetical protein
MKTTAFFGAAVAGAAAIASSAEATSGVELNELGSEGETLPRRVGLWDLTETRWTKPGAEPETSSGLVADVGMCFEEGFDDRWRCRRTHGAIDKMSDLRGCGRLMHEIAGNVLEQGGEIDFLLIVSAHCPARLLSDDGKKRLVISASIVHAGHEMCRSGA